MVKLCIRTCFVIFSDFSVIYYIIYGLTAVMGTFFHPVFFAFHLFDVINQYNDLMIVISALKETWF